MNIKDLEYIVAVAEFGHFGRAAESCGVTQPTLSMQLKKCEDMYSVTLFERRNKRVFVTPEGEIFLSHAREILNKFSQLKDSLSAMHNPLHSEVRMGVFPTLGPYILPSFIPRLQKAHPQLKLFLYEEKTAQLEIMLKEGKLDCALLGTDFNEKGFEVRSLFFDPFLVACSPQHTFKSKKKISIIDLETQSLLMLEEGHCLRNQFNDVCNMLKTKSIMQFQATSLETLRQMVSLGLGITLIPKVAAIKTKHILYKELVDPTLGRQIQFIHKKNSYKELAFTALYEQLILRNDNQA